MKSNKFPIVVKSFHFDMLDNPELTGNQDIQITVRDVVPQGGDADKEVKLGNFFEINVPFDVTPPNEQFHVSGTISRYIQVLDFHGHANEIDPDDLEKFSRPLVEYVETLTYAVTSVALNRGVQLNFHARAGEEDSDDD